MAPANKPGTSGERTYLRIREGGFFYVLTTDQSVSIEHRSRAEFELVGDGQSLHVAWCLSGDERVPVFRLGILLESRVGQWEYAVVLSDGTRRIGIAVAHVQYFDDADRPAIQAFSPVGSRVPGGPVIGGVCPRTQPEYLVLDTPRLQRCLAGMETVE